MLLGMLYNMPVAPWSMVSTSVVINGRLGCHVPKFLRRFAKPFALLASLNSMKEWSLSLIGKPAFFLPVSLSDNDLR